LYSENRTSFSRDPVIWNGKKFKSEEDIEALLNNNEHSDPVNAVENDLVRVGNLESIVSSETEHIKIIGY